jgi:hypothetical protein
MSAAVQLRPRTLANVLLDISRARDVWSATWRLETPDTERECAALDRLDALQDEARAMIEAATGCTWADIQGASL